MKVECSICPVTRSITGQRKVRENLWTIRQNVYPRLYGCFAQWDAKSFPHFIACPEAATPVTPRGPQEYLGEWSDIYCLYSEIKKDLNSKDPVKKFGQERNRLCISLAVSQNGGWGSGCLPKAHFTEEHLKCLRLCVIPVNYST